MKIKLTAVEYELMTIIWELEQASVREVMEHLPKNRKLAYTSIATIMRILEKKQVLRFKTIGRTHVFIPKISKESFIKETTSAIVTKMFAGNPLELVAHLLADSSISKEDVAAIKKLIQKKAKEVR